MKPAERTIASEIHRRGSSSGPHSVGQLSSRLGVTLSTASLLVGELSRAGFVVRAEDPNDRRRTIVDLAPEYSHEVGNFVAGRAGPIRSALEQLEPEERSAFVKGLRNLVAAFEAGAATTSD
jgi:DNA-binding MarR family transcriptional regulator